MLSLYQPKFSLFPIDTNCTCNPGYKGSKMLCQMEALSHEEVKTYDYILITRFENLMLKPITDFFPLINFSKINFTHKEACVSKGDWKELRVSDGLYILPTTLSNVLLEGFVKIDALIKEKKIEPNGHNYLKIMKNISDCHFSKNDETHNSNTLVSVNGIYIQLTAMKRYGHLIEQC